MAKTGAATTAAWIVTFLAAATQVPLSAADSPAGPTIPGYERFYTKGDTPDTAGGRLLLGELNCTACHSVDAAMAAWIAPKPAPVLDSVATRVKPEYLRRYLADPQKVEPGTTMPNVFVGTGEAKRTEQIEALVHFLAAGGPVPEARTDLAAVRRGETLFHSIGCAVCHGDRREGAATLATSISFPDLGAKYSVVSLTEFLRDPHAVRSGGRMPDFELTENQASDLANFLIPDANPRPREPRLTYRVYSGRFNNLPDFSMLKPTAQGQIDNFDIGVASADRNYAILYEGFLKIDRPGEYWFRLSSDDGSRLVIDGETVIDHDGVHPYSGMRGARKLEPGVHPVRVEYAQVAGEQRLTVHFEGPGVALQPMVNATFLTAEATLPKRKAAARNGKNDERFEFDPALAEKGRALFASLGCANCHQKKTDGVVVASTMTAPRLPGRVVKKGCLADAPSGPAVRYGLKDRQRVSIIAALLEFKEVEPTPAERIDAAFTRFNCYACHERGGKGGVEADRNSLFTSTVPEMGDEGRIPPHLTGVGDKLQVEWLRKLFSEGADDRSYMRTKMPNFGTANVGFLADALAAVDQRTEVTVPEIDLPKHRVEATGRQLVGESALSCIKCHNFGPHSGTGIQAIDMLTMTRRLRQDWFVRYMPDPQQYRPGTRMPSAFPNGKSVVRDVLEGNTAQQLASIWSYLDLGEKAPVPAGAVTAAIILTPKERPIVYRGFLEGLSPRGIAVGYPERVNIAFDAGQNCLALIWHNEFIDASQHWSARGAGTVRPQGDHTLSQVRGVPIAELVSNEMPWPEQHDTEIGWKFRGYETDSAGRPVFHYGTKFLRVEDAFQPVASAAEAASKDAGLHRVIRIQPAGNESLPAKHYFRLAAGRTIEAIGDNVFRIDDALTLRVSIPPDAPSPIVRNSDGQFELLIPVATGPKTAQIEIDYEW